jgi:hypothetical protein
MLYSTKQNLVSEFFGNGPLLELKLMWNLTFYIAGSIDAFVCGKLLKVTEFHVSDSVVNLARFVSQSFPLLPTCSQQVSRLFIFT